MGWFDNLRKIGLLPTETANRCRTCRAFGRNGHYQDESGVPQQRLDLTSLGPCLAEPSQEWSIVYCKRRRLPVVNCRIAAAFGFELFNRFKRNRAAVAIDVVGEVTCHG